MRTSWVLFRVWHSSWRKLQLKPSAHQAMCLSYMRQELRGTGGGLRSTVRRNALMKFLEMARSSPTDAREGLTKRNFSTLVRFSENFTLYSAPYAISRMPRAPFCILTHETTERIIIVANTDLILKLNAVFHFPWDENTWSLSTAPYAYIYNSYALNIWLEFYHGPFFLF